MEKVLPLLPDYDFHTIAIDVEQVLKENKVAKEKIVADLTKKIPIEDDGADIGMMRYVLAWNSPENQQAILKEISRIVKDFTVLQHAGADNSDPSAWREKMDELLGGAVPKIKRSGHFFSSREEIEKAMVANGINFERLLERRVEKVSNVFIERMKLDESEAKTAQNLLGDKDYIIQTTWLILPNATENKK